MNGRYYPPMKTIDQRRRWFSDIIFSFPYRLMNDGAQKTFIDFVSEQYNQYRKAISTKGKEIKGGSNLGKNEYHWIHDLFMQRIPLNCVIAAMTTGQKVYRELRRTINSIGAVKNQVGDELQRFRGSFIAHMEDHDWGGFEKEKLLRDRWFYQFYLKYYLKYNEEFYFDFDWGFLERKEIYLEKTHIWGTYIMLAEDIDELHDFARLLEVHESEFSNIRFPCYYVTVRQYRQALLLGARKDDREKIDLIIGRFEKLPTLSELRENTWLLEEEE